MRSVLVIGGSGFTGRRLLERAPNDLRVTALARSDASADRVEAMGAMPIRANAAEDDELERVIERTRPDIVITLTSLGLPWAPDMVRRLGEATGAPRLVCTSTTGIFTELAPASKAIRLESERQAMRFEHATIVRPTMIYGRPGDRNMERLLARLRTVPVIPAPDRGRTLQQPVHVDDLADCLWAAALEPAGRGALNCPGPRPLMFREVVRLAGTAIGRRTAAIGAPTKSLRGAVRVIEGMAARTGRRSPISTEQIDRLGEDKAFDAHDAMTLVGRRFRSFEDGITEEAELLGYRTTSGDSARTDR